MTLPEPTRLKNSRLVDPSADLLRSTPALDATTGQDRFSSSAPTVSGASLNDPIAGPSSGQPPNASNVLGEPTVLMGRPPQQPRGRSRRSVMVAAAAIGFVVCAAAVIVINRDETTVASGIGDDVDQLIAGSPDQAAIPPPPSPSDAELLKIGGLQKNTPGAERETDEVDPSSAAGASQQPSVTVTSPDSRAESTIGESGAKQTADGAVAASTTDGQASTTNPPVTRSGSTDPKRAKTSGATATTSRTPTISKPTATTRAAKPTTATRRTATTRPTTATTAATVTTVRATTTTARAATTSVKSATTSVRPTTGRATTTTTGRATTTTTGRAKTTTAKPTTTTTTPTTTTRATTTTAQSPGTPGRVIWEDNFSSFDSSTWKLEHSTYGDGNNELQCYRPENVSVTGGKLRLQAVTETYTCPNGSTRQVTSGMIRSRGVTFSPGQAIEFRVKLNPANPNDQGGLWPAVWASGWGGGGWPQSGEMDWLEVMTAENARRAMFSVHYADPSGSHKHQNKGVIGSDYFSDSWHTVRFDYGTGGRLTWYLDGQVAFQVNGASTLQGYPAPFDETVGEIKINLALGGRPGPLAAGAVGSNGASFEVDYIRILEL